MEVNNSNENALDAMTDEQLGIKPETELDVQKKILAKVESIRAAVYFFVWMTVFSMLIVVIYLLYAYAWD